VCEDAFAMELGIIGKSTVPFPYNFLWLLITSELHHSLLKISKIHTIWIQEMSKPLGKYEDPEHLLSPALFYSSQTDSLPPGLVLPEAT